MARLRDAWRGARLDDLRRRRCRRSPTACRAHRARRRAAARAPAACARGCAAPARRSASAAATPRRSRRRRRRSPRELDAEVRASTQALIRLHGLEGSAEGDDPGAAGRPTTRCACASTKARRRSGAARQRRAGRPQGRRAERRPDARRRPARRRRCSARSARPGWRAASTSCAAPSRSWLSPGTARRSTPSSRRRCCATSRSRTSAAAAATGPRASRRRTGRTWCAASLAPQREALARAVERPAAARRRGRRAGRERGRQALRRRARADRSRRGARDPVARSIPRPRGSARAVPARVRRPSAHSSLDAMTSCRSPRSISGSTSRRRIRTSPPSGSRRSPPGTAGPCAGRRSCSA